MIYIKGLKDKYEDNDVNMLYKIIGLGVNGVNKCTLTPGLYGV